MRTELKGWTLGALVLIVVIGCGDRGPGVEVLRDFESGAPRDEVMSALPAGPLSEAPQGWTLAQGYRNESFLLDSRMWEVVYFTDAGFSAADSLDGGRQTPVVFVDDGLDGWGWTHMTRLHREVGMPLPPAAPGGRATSADDPEVALMGEAFWRTLGELCGNAYPGALGVEPEGDPMLDGDELLIAHFRSCSDDEILVPFHIEREGGASWDRSRTWVYRNHGNGRLELRHDHRRPDGAEDDVTWYGAFRVGTGTPHRQEFLYDPAEYPDRAGRGWRIEIVPGTRYSYGTIRDGEWSWRVDFDLSRPLSELPPAPWGHEEER